MNKILDIPTTNPNRIEGIVEYIKTLFDYTIVSKPRVNHESTHTDIGTVEKLTEDQINEVIAKVELTNLHFVDYKGYVHN